MLNNVFKLYVTGLWFLQPKWIRAVMHRFCLFVFVYTHIECDGIIDAPYFDSAPQGGLSEADRRVWMNVRPVSPELVAPSNPEGDEELLGAYRHPHRLPILHTWEKRGHIQWNKIYIYHKNI